MCGCESRERSVFSIITYLTFPFLVMCCLSMILIAKFSPIAVRCPSTRSGRPRHPVTQSTVAQQPHDVRRNTSWRRDPIRSRTHLVGFEPRMDHASIRTLADCLPEEEIRSLKLWIQTGGTSGRRRARFGVIRAWRRWQLRGGTVVVVRRRRGGLLLVIGRDDRWCLCGGCQ